MITSVDQLIPFLNQRTPSTSHCTGYKLKLSQTDALRIADVLQYAYHLKEFTLLSCDFNDETALVLASALSQCAGLTALHISHCTTLTPKGALEFLRCLQTCRQLSILSFNGIGLTDQSVKVIADSLLNNTQIKELNLANNSINTLDTLCHLLRFNHNVVNINVTKNPFSISTFVLSSVPNITCNKMMKLLIDNQHLRNLSRYHGLEKCRMTYQYYKNITTNPVESLSLGRLRPVFQLYGLNALPTYIESQLIYLIYLTQILKEIFRANQKPFVDFLIFNIVEFIAHNDTNAKPPAFYTNTLFRLNQQKQVYSADKDDKALAINTKALNKLSLYPLRSAQIEPSRFWWFARKMERCFETTPQTISINSPSK